MKIDTAKLSMWVPGVRYLERGRMWVRSRTDPWKEYLVDLVEYDGNGACTCDDFAFRKAPMLERGFGKLGRIECWHIKQAKRFFAEIAIMSVIESEKQNKPQNKCKNIYM